jgi:hypothetical protein
MNDTWKSEPASEEELNAHEAFMEEVRTADPKQSCEMIRAWLKLNIEASMCPVWNN